MLLLVRRRRFRAARRKSASHIAFQRIARQSAPNAVCDLYVQFKKKLIYARTELLQIPPVLRDHQGMTASQAGRNRGEGREMMKIGKIWQIGLAMLVAFCAGQVAAQEGRERDCSLVGGDEFGDWQIYQSASNCPKKECGASSSPVNTVNTRDGRTVQVRRGTIKLFVTATSLSSTDSALVSFNSGYPFADDSDVLAEIDNATEFTFQIGQEDAHLEWAWPLPADDDRLVSAMKKGNRIVLSGISGRGTNTRDTFSLKGFTAALENAVELCAR